MADVITLIEQDHRKVERVFEQLKKTKEPSERQELLTRLHRLLDPHTKAEEAIVYPAMESAGVESLDTSSANEEHDHVAKLLTELMAEGPEAEAFGQKVETIEAAVKHHVKEEEEEMLPEFRRKSDSGTREQLGSAFEQDELSRLALMGGRPAEVLVDLTKDELSKLAADKCIEGRSSMSKDELISAIAAAS